MCANIVITLNAIQAFALYVGVRPALLKAKFSIVISVNAPRFLIDANIVILNAKK